MTKKFLSMAAIAMLCAACMTSCDDDDDDDDITTITFENFDLGDNEAKVGVSAQTENIFFKNDHRQSDYGEYNAGFTLSTMTDQTTAGPENQYSVYAKSGADGSKTFVIYNPSYGDPCDIYTKTDKTFKPVSVDVCLTTYTYLSAKNGDDFAKKFTDDDWFFATFTGYDVDNKETASIDVKLIDHGKWIDTWTRIDLAELGDVNKISIDFDGSDKSEWENESWLNTPAYIALDNLRVRF